MKSAVPVFVLAIALTQSAAMGQSSAISGVVAETIETKAYLYLRLEDPENWVATSLLDIEVGDEVEFAGGMEMRDFHSKALDRTFESIWFVQLVEVAGGELDLLHHGGQATAGEPVAAPGPGAIPAPQPGEIAKLEGGMDIAGILAQGAALSGQEITLRARVVKVANDIMGKNWVTLQDGSGAESDKLIATTTQSVNAGGTVRRCARTSTWDTATFTRYCSKMPASNENKAGQRPGPLLAGRRSG
jgi:hypothetical protein